MEKREVDNYTIDCFRNCPQLYYWRIKRGLVLPSEKKLSLLFGEAVHYGLEEYYKGGMTQQAIDDGMVKAVDFFVPYDDHSDEKRTSSNLVSLLGKYFERYRVEPFDVFATEVGGAFELSKDYIYTSRLDLLVEWKNPKGMYVVDHKTTYDIGSLIAKPHNQVTGYIATVMEIYENVLGGMINGLGVYKNESVMDKNAPKVPSPITGKLIYQTKARELFIRIPTQRTIKEVEEWKKETLWTLHQIEECEEKNLWPKYSNNCTKFKGKCMFMDLCNAMGDVAERLIEQGVYVKDEWKAYQGAAGEDVG